MSFKLLLADPDGGVPTVLMEVDDRRVERVGLATSRGECGAAKIDPNTTEVLISLEYAHVDGRPTIYDLEAMQHPTLQGNEVQRRMDVLQELPSGTNTGNDSILKGAEAQQEEREIAAEQADDDSHPEPSSEDPDADPDNLEEEQENSAPTEQPTPPFQPPKPFDTPVEQPENPDGPDMELKL